MVVIPHLGGLNGSYQRHLGLSFVFGGTCSANWNGELVWCVSRLHWFPIFLCNDNHCTAPISGGTDWYGIDDASLDIIPEGLLYFFPVVVRYWDGVMFGFVDCPIFEVNMSWKAGHCREFPTFVEHCVGKLVQ